MSRNLNRLESVSAYFWEVLLDPFGLLWVSFGGVLGVLGEHGSLKTIRRLQEAPKRAQRGSKERLWRPQETSKKPDQISIKIQLQKQLIFRSLSGDPLDHIFGGFGSDFYVFWDVFVKAFWTQFFDVILWSYVGRFA